MYTLAIADDEARQRQGLCDYVDWASLGFEILGAFADGADLIGFLEKRRVDAVLTDIKMSDASGLDVAAYISERCPDTTVIFISGHKEFELAKKAMDYRVWRYVVKPVGIGEIRSVFTDLRAELDQRRKLDDDRQACARVAEELLPLFRSPFFQDLLSGAGGALAGANPGAGAIGGTAARGGAGAIGGDGGGAGSCGRSGLAGPEARAACGPGASNILIDKAKAFIAQNFASDLSLRDVAEHVFLNPVYFSRFFKQKTGENFVDYLAAVRMERAIAMLAAGKYKVYEIAERTGYRNTKYFARLFRHYTGYSPKNYLRAVIAGAARECSPEKRPGAARGASRL
jgi:YesN/AraC family two-component response regulator